MQPTTIITRKTTQLYRDCLRLIQHVAGRSAKGVSLRVIVRNEFKKNAHIKDNAIIDNLKSNAIRGLANYLMLESASKDTKLNAKSNAYMKEETDRMQNNKINGVPIKQDKII